MAIKKIAYIEMYVDNADEIAAAYETTFGLTRVAEASQDTGLVGRRSIALALGDAHLLLTSALTDESVAAYVREHGDGVRDVAFAVSDVEAVYETAIRRGAAPAQPHARAIVGGFGNLVHTLVEHDEDSTMLPACYRAVATASTARANRATPFAGLDHVAMCLETGTLERVASYYERIFDFVQTYEQTIETPVSGMNAKVVENPTGTVKFPLQEPLPGRGGPIQAFLDDHRGPGVYHLGLLTDDIVHSLRGLRERGVHVLETPGSYYDMLPARVGEIDEDLETLRELNILVDLDKLGYLLQVFTRSLHARRTFFLEIIQREQANSFGNGNVRALFDAVEREACTRG